MFIDFSYGDIETIYKIDIFNEYIHLKCWLCGEKNSTGTVD